MANDTPTRFSLSRLLKGLLLPAPRLHACSPGPGRADLFTLTAIDRHDHPGGRRPWMPPGQPASYYLWVAEHASGEIDVAALFAEDSSFVLYSVENSALDDPLLVFVELTPEAGATMWLQEAFIDRGVRKLLQVGSRVAVARMSAVETAVSAAITNLTTGEWNLQWVWNTGRCGSTLLHKAVSAAGVASLSEPHWLDQLHFAQKPSPPQLQRAVRVCVATEALTVRRQTQIAGWSSATDFCINPKAGGLHIAEAVAVAFPKAKHAFMYRACHKVVESFGGLMFSGGVPWMLRLSWALFGTRALPKPARDDRLPLSRFSCMPAAMLTCRWLSTIRGWVEMTQQRAAAAGGAAKNDVLCSAVVLRMDEFTSKDLAVRGSVLKTVLGHFNLLRGDTDSVMERALKVFSVHSQKGSSMSGPKTKILTDTDTQVVHTCVATAMADVPAVVVQGGGANVVLPSSLGVAAGA